MLKHQSDGLDMRGYFLPEDSRCRLKKLHEHMKFLLRMAQPRTSDEAQEWVPEMRVGEMAICLELLAEQVELALEELSWPAQQTAKMAKAHADAADEASEDDDAERFSFGVTLDQIDVLDRLIQTISAYGDVVAGSHDAELAKHTLPLIGQAIHDGAKTVRAILNEVEEQRLQPQSQSKRVGETRATYGTGFARPGARRCPEPGIRHGQNQTLQ